MKISRFGFVAAVCLFLASSLQAKDIPLPPDHFIYEETQTIDTPSRTELEHLTTEHERLTGEQIYVAVFKSLDGENLTQYSEKIFRSWKIGQFKKNNGVLILISTHEKAAKISIGFGLEHLLSTDQADTIAQQYLLSEVKVGNIGPGLIQTVQSVLKAIGSPLAPAIATQPNEPKTYNFGKWPYLFILVIFLTLAYVADKIVAAEAVFSKNGWKRVPILSSPFIKNKISGGGTHGPW